MNWHRHIGSRSWVLIITGNATLFSLNARKGIASCSPDFATGTKLPPNSRKIGLPSWTYEEVTIIFQFIGIADSWKTLSIFSRLNEKVWCSSKSYCYNCHSPCYVYKRRVSKRKKIYMRRPGTDCWKWNSLQLFWRICFLHNHAIVA